MDGRNHTTPTLKGRTRAISVLAPDIDRQDGFLRVSLFTNLSSSLTFQPLPLDAVLPCLSLECLDDAYAGVDWYIVHWEGLLI